MKIQKEFLRESARLALREKGYEVELAPGPGIVPGARLNATKDGELLLVAVRTSLDREVGLLRNATGTWRTIPNVDLVVVAVPAAGDAQAVEVLAFEAEALIKFFDATVKVVEKGNKSKARFKAPIFVALDDTKKTRTREARKGLKGEAAAWQVEIPFGHPEIGKTALASLDPRANFIERVKQEIAEIMGVDVRKVVLEIRIVA